MATADYSNIAGALATIFEDQIASQFNRATVLSKLLPYRPTVGKNIVWDAEFGDLPNTSVLADGSPVTDFNNDTIVPATLTTGTYSEGFGVTGKALAAAAAAGNPAALADLFGEKLDRAVMRLAANINLDFYTGANASDTIVGMTSTDGGLVATGTYAGLARGTYAAWAGNELLNNGAPRALSFKLMRDAIRTIYEASGMSPDLIVCDPFTWSQYGLLFGNDRRYQQDVYLRGQKITLDGGLMALAFDGVPVVQDIHCPAGTMIFLNTNFVAIRQLPDAMGGVPGRDGGDGMVRLHGTAEAQYGDGPSGLTARINPLAVSGDKYNFQLVLYPQLQVRRPNSCAILGDLLTS